MDPFAFQTELGTWGAWVWLDPFLALGLISGLCLRDYMCTISLFSCTLVWSSAVESVSAISSFSLRLSETGLLLLSVLLLVVFCAGWRKELRGKGHSWVWRRSAVSKFRAVYLVLLRQSMDLDLDPLFPHICHCNQSIKWEQKVCVDLRTYASLLESWSKEPRAKISIKKTKLWNWNNSLKFHLKPLRLIWAFKRSLSSN